VKVFALALLAALCLTSTAAAALPGKVVARKSVSGQFAVTAIHASVKKPSGLWIRFVGKVSTGEAVVACTRGLSISSNGKSFRKAGLYRLPIKPLRADSCDIIGSVGGSGRISLEIRATR
jgi:hypothetical protein